MKPAKGIDDFKKLRERNYTYVDKSLFIEDVIEDPAEVQLITRPRRFGKTLNMSTLSYFFDCNQESRHLFKGLSIEKRPCFEEYGTRPVIFLTFKELKTDDFETFLVLYSSMMSVLYQKHGYVRASLEPVDLENYDRVLHRKAEKGDLLKAIMQLTTWLEAHHGKKVVLLIDEYDSPIHEAYQAGYYEPLITFLRGALGNTLKGNLALHKAVLTGILRISKESIFSDLNHIEVSTVLDSRFDNRFGFTEDEVEDLLQQADRQEQLAEVRNWYNGYRIGNAIVYNPWSLLSYIGDPSGECKTYWVNTSSNNLIYELLTQAEVGTHETLTDLINDGQVESPIHPQATLRNLNGKALWSLLLFSGYLTSAGSVRKGARIYYRLCIPNTEVRSLYQDIFMEWLDNRISESAVANLLDALVQGDIPTFERHFGKLVRETLSFYDASGDAPERVYHAFVLGLLANLDYRYYIRSNRESGYGRYDLMMIPRDSSEIGVIVEFKLADSPETLEEEATRALAQITVKDYAAELKAQGVTRYNQIGIALGKQIKVVGGLVQ